MEVLLLILRIKLKGFYFLLYFCIYIVEEDDEIKALRKFGFDLVFSGRRFFLMEKRRAVERIKSWNSLIIVLNDKKFWFLLSNDCETRASWWRVRHVNLITDCLRTLLFVIEGGHVSQFGYTRWHSACDNYYWYYITRA